MSKSSSTWTPVVAVIASVLSLSACAQQIPVNDNFTNRIVLSGNDLTFTGSLAGTGVETQFEGESPYYGPIKQSVWWTWTATLSTVLNLQLVGNSPEPAIRHSGPVEILSVFHSEAPGALPDSSLGSALGVMHLADRLDAQTLSVPVEAGKSYQIQLAGDVGGPNYVNHTFRLLATNVPIIHLAPRSLAVSPNDHQLLFVEASGAPPLSYQWQHEGTNLSGEIAPMLVLTNIQEFMAGEYSVVVSNAYGVTVAKASLSVSPTPVAPLLRALNVGLGVLSLSLTGESGRYYRVSTSTNLIDWLPEQNFPINNIGWQFTSVVYCANELLSFGVPSLATQKYARASVYSPAGSLEERICVNNLRQLRAAKRLFRRASGCSLGYTPIDSNIMVFLPHQKLPLCPLDMSRTRMTSYTMGVCLTESACVISPQMHLLEEPE